MDSYLGEAKKYLNSVRKNEMIIRIIGLMFLGATINIFFIGATAWDFANTVQRLPVQLTNGVMGISNNTDVMLPTGTVVVVIKAVDEKTQPFQVTLPVVVHYSMYFVLSIVYSVLISIIFKPKRFVSPFFIQMITLALLSVILVTPFILYIDLIKNPVLVYNYFMFIFVILPVFVLVGMMQSEIARRIVGLNEPFDDLDKTVKIFQISFEKLKKIVLDESFLSLGEFVLIRQKNKKKLILESRSKTSEKVIITITPHTDDNTSILAAFCYETVSNTMVQSKSAVAWLNSIMYYLNEQVGKPINDEKDLTKTDAYNTALRYTLNSTKPKIANITYLPKYQITTLIATAIIGGLLTIAWYFFKFLDNSAYITTLGLIAFELLIVFVPLMVDKMREDSEEAD